MAVEERIAPHSEEAEIGVLGCMLLDRGVVGEVVQIIKKDDFYSPSHGDIYDAVLELYDQNQAVDVILVAEALKRRGALERTGGMDYLADLVDAVPSAANAEYYARVVREKGVRRRLISEATEILRESYSEREDIEALLDRTERRIFSIADGQEIGESIHIKDILDPIFKRLDVDDRKGRLTGLATGYYGLDDLTCGLQDSELIVLAARPSIGKTSLALCIIQNVAVSDGQPVALFTLEMSKQQVAQNMLCSRARVNAHKLRRGQLGHEDYGELALHGGKLAQAKIFIDDSTGLTPLQLRAKARRLKAEHDVRFIVVDYLQLMHVPRAESRQQEIAEISRTLKGLARELGVPVLAVSQLNRAPEMRESHEPRLSDLRESGAIEQDADVVMMLHRDDYYDENKNPGLAQLRIAKQRNGPVGTIKLTFLRECMRFESYTDEEI